MIKIAILTPDHATALNSLIQTALEDYPTAFTTDFSTTKNRSVQIVIDHLKDLENSAGFRLGAFDANGTLVGTVRLDPRPGPKRSHAADLMVLFVRIENQNQGIGRLLVETTIEMARKIDGLEQLELVVSQDAPAAIHLYEKLGFKSTGVLKRQIKIGNNYHDCVAMWLRLYSG